MIIIILDTFIYPSFLCGESLRYASNTILLEKNIQYSDHYYHPTPMTQGVQCTMNVRRINEKCMQTKWSESLGSALNKFKSKTLAVPVVSGCHQIDQNSMLFMSNSVEISINNMGKKKFKTKSRHICDNNKNQFMVHAKQFELIYVFSTNGTEYKRLHNHHNDNNHYRKNLPNSINFNLIRIWNSLVCHLPFTFHNGLMPVGIFAYSLFVKYAIYAIVMLKIFMNAIFDCWRFVSMPSFSLRSSLFLVSTKNAKSCELLINTLRFYSDRVLTTTIIWIWNVSIIK